MKNKILSISFLIIIFSFFIFNIIIKDQEISKSERRKLTSINDLKNNFNANLDKYLSDQIPLREELLTINNAFNRYLLQNQEYNDVYLQGEYIIEKNYPLDEQSLSNFLKVLNNIQSKYLANSNCYYTIIPDKSYFLNNKYLTLDYEYLYNNLNKKINMSYLNIKDILTLEDYYKTDIHLKQESYFKIINQLSEKLNFKIQDIKYNINSYSNFKGTSFYKVPFSKEETLNYLTNDYQKNISIKHLEYNDSELYKTIALNSSDAYNVFLSGPSSLITITNNNLENDTELIIFRDSFGSSLAPLLTPYYKKITLIDLRYINMKLVNNYVDFNNKDILFIYSTLIVNNSYTLKNY